MKIKQYVYFGISSLVKLSGQHQLLGWYLHRDRLAFLHDVGAEIDADEYG